MTRAFALLFLLCSLPLLADGPADNIPEKVRPLPMRGVEVPADKKEKLEAGLAELRQKIDALKTKEGLASELWPDVEIYYRAVHDGLLHQEFLKTADIDQAFTLLDLGRQRAADLAEGKAPWTRQTGLLVRGFVSKLDGSVQPYGLWVPKSYAFDGAAKYRLDFWFHGRHEVLTEGTFLVLRTKSPDQIPAAYAPKDTIVLYPYARYCNASKFAGEVDSLEALAEAQKRYRIDAERISVRGFSMGGAATWHFAVHYADRWFAATPGAGFSETPCFLDFFQKEKLNPTPWEKKLWAMYDCDKYALNLLQLPTLAYSGADDIQKQAADVMVEALKTHGVDLVHYVAPKTGHKVQPEFGRQIEARVEALARSGRQRVPPRIAFETYTLKYNRMHWVTVDGLGEHWARANVHAAWSNGPARVSAETGNVTDLTFSMEPGDCPFDPRDAISVTLDGQEFKDVPRAKSDRSWFAQFHREGNTWKSGARASDGLRKRHNLQGPIDDALMDSFLFVRPTGTSPNAATDAWAKAELERALHHWRLHFRGYARVKDDTAVTDDDIASHNLILWGDASSNALIKKIADRLPIRCDAKQVQAGVKTFDAAHHAAILVHPNPLNPERYVVLNSSFTFREYAYLNNARQVPMLPDWAIVDVREKPTTIWPGKIVDAGFFDEAWKLK